MEIGNIEYLGYAFFFGFAFGLASYCGPMLALRVIRGAISSTLSDR